MSRTKMFTRILLRCNSGNYSNNSNSDNINKVIIIVIIITIIIITVIVIIVTVVTIIIMSNNYSYWNRKRYEVSSTACIQIM